MHDLIADGPRGDPFGPPHEERYPQRALASREVGAAPRAGEALVWDGRVGAGGGVRCQVCRLASISPRRCSKWLSPPPPGRCTSVGGCPAPPSGRSSPRWRTSRRSRPKPRRSGALPLGAPLRRLSRPHPAGALHGAGATTGADQQARQHLRPHAPDSRRPLGAPGRHRHPAPRRPAHVGARKGHNIAAVALANKLARVCWRVWRDQRSFERRDPR